MKYLLGLLALITVLAVTCLLVQVDCNIDEKDPVGYPILECTTKIGESSHAGNTFEQFFARVRVYTEK